MKCWCKLPEDGDNAGKCSSCVIKQYINYRVLLFFLLPEF